MSRPSADWESDTYWIASKSIFSVDWGGSCILFHRASGETHSLNELGANLIRRLTEGPVTLGELRNLIDNARISSVVSGGLLDSQLYELIARFEELGLILECGDIEHR